MVDQTVTRGVDEEGHGISGEYRFGPVKLSGQYGEYERTGTTKQKSYQVGAQWYTGKHQFIATYSASKDGGANGAVQPECDLTAVGYRYNFSRRTFFITSYARVQNDQGNLCNFGSGGAHHHQRPGSAGLQRRHAHRVLTAPGFPPGLEQNRIRRRTMKSRFTALALAMLAVPGIAAAADTTQVPCRTTEECNALAARIGAVVPAPGAKGNATSAIDQAEDQFYWLNKINKASAVMLVEEKIVSPDLGPPSRGRKPHHRAGGKPDGKRPSDVLQIEKIITDEIGPDASLIHTGRSRQDMYATYRMAKLRNELLDFSDALNGMRERVLAAVRRRT